MNPIRRPRKSEGGDFYVCGKQVVPSEIRRKIRICQFSMHHLDTRAPATHLTLMVSRPSRCLYEKSNADATDTTFNLAGYYTFVAFADNFYKVQTGAFTSKVNVERSAEELRRKGFDVMVVIPSA